KPLDSLNHLTLPLILDIKLTFNVNVGHKNCVNYSTAIEPFFVHNGDHKKERKSEKSLFSGEYPAQKTTFSCFH
uniref:hypothetical protein n=1 Tax=Yersinia pestis TaxID=632 RepID=UPI000A9DE236